MVVARPNPQLLNPQNMDYKATLNLPKTDFPMRANLPKREPQLLEKWEKEGIYHQIQEKTAGRPKYILHDGPPYANGHIHLGTALNKILKDIIVKSRTMMGYNSPYIPGWDCHGLPIEHNVEVELTKQGKTLSKGEIRRYCRKYAENFLNIQREEFKRLGVLGDWENPYVTMNYAYEANTMREFGKFVEAGSVDKRLMSVRWCISCETALAEAEVEYETHTSPSVYVKFPLDSDPKEIAPELAGKTVSVIIWTTTPWTLPANLGIAFHPDLTYIAVEQGATVYIFAEGFLEDLVQRFDWKEYAVLARFPGSQLEGCDCRHPFIDRKSKLILADYVTLEQGTGCVHTAPGHGREDYETGLRYGLDIYAPVDNQGKFTKDVEHFAGMQVFEANQAIIDLMKKDGSLMASEHIAHDYPHCWRCKNPVIFRATAQWFILLERDDLRKRALENIRTVRWIPEWGEDRIYSMIENRPDWCISRQRAWGVPIVAFYCNDCGALLLKKEIVDFVADNVTKGGADLWFDLPESELLPEGTRCEKCGASSFTKETDILDVWFDSGVSHAVVCEPNPLLGWPVDLYLEGSDQHRGWFHSTLLESVGTRGKAPYRAVLTHGYTVDEKGRKMSKSLGNTVAPQDVIKKYGAEILRLWVSYEDYRSDIAISGEMLKHIADAYRRIRNTCRYMLGNLYDFDPSKNAVPYEELADIDKWALHRLQHLIKRVRKAYNDFEFHVFFHTFHNFCVVDMSSFYLDILKDRMYTTKADSKQRRSGQTAMYEILSGMVKLMTPILSFSAEECWGHLAKDGKSVLLEDLPEVDESRIDDALDERWSRVITVRGDILKRLEVARKDEKIIGHSLDARVEIYASGDILELLHEFEEQLDDICIVSEAAVYGEDTPVPDEAIAGEEVENISVRIAKAHGEKCPRCWHYRINIAENPEYPEICAQCATAMS